MLVVSENDVTGGKRFSYSPLKGKNDIRIIKLSPLSFGGQDPELGYTLNILHTDLDESPLYTAVSYMWGAPDEVMDIDVDGKPLSVRSNLKHMLTDLCDQRLPRYLWIDAICINQDDNSERSAQVNLMGSIFARANYVIAYLTSPPGKKPLNLQQAAKYVLTRAQRYGDSQLKEGPDYLQLFNNPYFTRRWIIQEVCLARSVILRCEGYDLPIGMLNHYFELSDGSRYSESLAARLCALRRRTEHPSSTLEELLYDHSHAVCSITLDKIYALLALTREAKSFLKVDYTLKSVDLLLSILETSTTHEDLPPERLLGFSCFLQKDLNLTRSDLRTAMGHRANDNVEFMVQATCRGVVRSLRVDAHSEDCIHEARHRLPGLLQYPPITLQPTPTQAEEFSACQTQNYRIKNEYPDDAEVDASQEVNPLALWGFSYESSLSSLGDSWKHGSSKADSESEFVYCGLGTTATEPGDEIWQFVRAPVAVIMRKIGNQHRLAGRALLLNITMGRERRASSDDTGNSRHLRTMVGNCAGNLLEFLEWLEPAPKKESMSESQNLPDPFRTLESMTAEEWAAYDPKQERARKRKKKQAQMQEEREEENRSRNRRSISVSLSDLLQLMTWVNMDDSGDINNLYSHTGDGTNGQRNTSTQVNQSFGGGSDIDPGESEESLAD